MGRIETLGDNSVAGFDLLKLQRRTNSSQFENVGQILKNQNENINEMRQRVGPLHESVVRLRLEATRGAEWFKSKTIYGLSDVFNCNPQVATRRMTLPRGTSLFKNRLLRRVF
jgi:hypothetical protein